MSFFDVLLPLILTSVFIFGFLSANQTPQQKNKPLAKLVVKYTNEFIYLKRNLEFEIHSLEEWFDFLESNNFAKNKYRYYYDKLLAHAIAKNSEDLDLMIEDRKRFFTEHNDGSRWFKNILKKYDKQIKFLKNRLENAEMQVLYYFIRGALGGKSKIAQEYAELAGETLKQHMETTGDSKNYHPDLFSEVIKNPHYLQEGIFEEVEFP